MMGALKHRLPEFKLYFGSKITQLHHFYVPTDDEWILMYKLVARGPKMDYILF